MVGDDGSTASVDAAHRPHEPDTDSESRYEKEHGTGVRKVA